MVIGQPLARPLKSSSLSLTSMSLTWGGTGGSRKLILSWKVGSPLLVFVVLPFLQQQRPPFYACLNKDNSTQSIQISSLYHPLL